MSLRQTLEERGFALAPALLNAAEVEQLRKHTADVGKTEAVRSRRETYAIRNLLQVVPEVAGFVSSGRIQALAEEALGGTARAVRGILFDKTPDANWLVPWHQDLTICVRQRREVPDFGPWTLKAGVHHVQPPVSYLEKMLAIRIHLDDCGEHDGPLKVIPGSHRLGRLSAQQIAEIVSGSPAVACTAGCGSALLMKPLLLHASSAAERPSHRRVIHIEFASAGLPSGLEWLS